MTLPADAKWADGRYTAFGRVGQTDGSMEVRRSLSSLARGARFPLAGLNVALLAPPCQVIKKLSGLKTTGTKSKPVHDVFIVDCGIL